MRIICVAHLAYYMFAAVGVAAEVTVDATSLRLNALEEAVSTLVGVVTKLREDIDVVKEDNDVLKEDNNVLKEDNNVLRNELNSIRSRRTTSTTLLDKCFKVGGKGNKKLFVRCDTTFFRPTVFSQAVRIDDDVRVIKGNLMITNGEKYTDLNGKGNLIIGASEVTQAGAHNIVLGTSHTFSSYGGFVAGYYNTVSGPYSTVSGGHYNTASGYSNAVSGGWGNIANGAYNTVIGGKDNKATDTETNDVVGQNSTTSLDTCLKVRGKNKKKLVVECDTEFMYPTEFNSQYESQMTFELSKAI